MPLFFDFKERGPRELQTGPLLSPSLLNSSTSTRKLLDLARARDRGLRSYLPLPRPLPSPDVPFSYLPRVLPLPFTLYVSKSPEGCSLTLRGSSHSNVCDSKGFTKFVISSRLREDFFFSPIRGCLDLWWDFFLG